MKPHFFRKAVLLAGLLAPLFLSGCLDTAAINDDILADQKTANTALKTLEAKPYVPQSFIVDERPWYGARAVPVQHGEALPSEYMGSDGLVLTFERPMDLREVARMIQAATNIRTIAESQGDATGSGRQFLPVDGVEVTGGRVVWQGPLPDLLEQVADTFDAEWEYDGSVIRITDEITRIFMLHALADTIEYNSGIENADDDSGVLPEVGITSTSTLEIWTDIEEAVGAILNQRGRASFSATTGTITVSGAPSVVNKVEEYLRDQNDMRLRRVAVAVKVLSLITSDTNTLNFNLSGLIERAIDGRPFQFSSVGDGLTAGILRQLPNIDPITGLPGAGVQADTDEISSIFEASEDIQRVSLSNSGAVVTLSDIPAPLQIGRTVAYLERVSSSSGDDGNVSLEPGELSLGLTMNVLPRVIQRDKILLRLAVGITDAQQPFDDISIGELRIQLPEVSTTGFLQNAVLSKGETLVLAGFEKNQTALDDEGAPGGLWTGGQRLSERTREVTVLLITAEVLPEEPLVVIGR